MPVDPKNPPVSASHAVSEGINLEALLLGIMTPGNYRQLMTAYRFLNPATNPQQPDTRAQTHKAMDVAINLMVVDADRQDSLGENNRIDKQQLLDRIHEKMALPGAEGAVAGQIFTFVSAMDTMKDYPDSIDTKSFGAALHQVLDPVAEMFYTNRHPGEKALPYTPPEKMDFDNNPEPPQSPPPTPTPPVHKSHKHRSAPQQPQKASRGFGGMIA